MFQTMDICQPVRLPACPLCKHTKQQTRTHQQAMHRWLQCLPAQAWKPTCPLKPDMYFLYWCETIKKFKNLKQQDYPKHTMVRNTSTETKHTLLKLLFFKQTSAEPYYGQKQHNPWNQTHTSFTEVKQSSSSSFLKTTSFTKTIIQSEKYSF